MLITPPERFRVIEGPMSSPPNVPYGAFILDSIESGWSLILICDNGEETNWEHISVRAHRLGKINSRIPTWKEMHQVKSLCWEPEDTVMQLHPAQSRYVNRHPHVLHLWRPVKESIPVPPLDLV